LTVGLRLLNNKFTDYAERLQPRSIFELQKS
jgi:hypothetical protein